MTTASPSTEPRSVTVTPLGGLRRAGRVRLPRRTVLVTLIGGMDLDLRDAELPAEGADLLKVSVIGGVSVTVPPDVRVDVRGFTLLGGKAVERPAGPQAGPVLRLRAFGLIGGVRVRVAAPTA